MQQPDDLHKHDGECKKPDTEQYQMILFTQNSRKVKSVAVEGRWVIARDGSQKETWGYGNALYFEGYGSSRGAVSVQYLHLECCGGGYTGVHTFVETHKSVHLKCVHYRDAPGDLVVKTSRFQCRGLRLDPWSGNQDPTGHGMQPKNKKISDVHIILCVSYTTMVGFKYMLCQTMISRVKKNQERGAGLQEQPGVALLNLVVKEGSTIKPKSL